MKKIRSVEMFEKDPSEEEKAKWQLDDNQRRQTVAIVIDVEECVRLDYLWYKQYPVCLDAFYVTVMDTLLEKRGWKRGEKRISFKNELSANEVLKCVAFKSAYEKVYDEVVFPCGQFEEIDMTTEVFLGCVDKRFEEMRKNWISKYPDVTTVEALIVALKAEGFSPTYP